jgi:hypothetical protein
MRKKENKASRCMLTSYEEDCVWMSYRYCIGRSTIAAHCHASDIAENTYGRLSNERTEFMSNDINQSIYDILRVHNFADFGWYGNIPKNVFRPLDVLYSILDKEEIDSHEKIRKIKEISIEWNRDKQDYDYAIYWFSDNDKNKDYGRSLSTYTDLEIWQQLANLFDLSNHKWCKLTDGTLCEYYECWKHKMIDGKIKFEKYKIPTDRLNLSILTYIPQDSILEDNIEQTK